MRILLLILQYPPDINPTGVLMGQLCERLRDRGHEISVITSFPHYDGFRIKPSYRGKLTERRRENGIDVRRLYVYAPGRKTVVNRLISYLSFSLMAGLADLFDRTRYDVILCPNGGFITGMVAYLSGLHKQVPFIYNVQDLYPDVPMQTGDLSNKKAIAILRRLEKFMYGKAAHITTVSSCIRQCLLEREVPEDKVTHIPNFVDIEIIRPAPMDNAFRRDQGLENAFLINYAGNMGSVYDFKTLVDVAVELESFTDIVFLIVGEGVRKEEAERAAGQRGLKNMSFLPYQPRDVFLQIRAASNVQLSLYRVGSARFSLSSKIYEIMAAGRPLLAAADRDSDIWDIVHTTGCGLCVEPEKPDQLLEAVLTLYQNKDECRTMGERGRRSAERRYSKETVALQYEQLLRKTVNQG